MHNGSSAVMLMLSMLVACGDGRVADYSPLFPDSVFFADGDTPATATALTPLDLQLLRFMYTELQPADGEDEVLTAFDTAWPR